MSVSQRATIIGLGSLAGTGHMLYPAFMAIRTRRTADEPAPRPTTWLPVTVVIPAFREAAVIADKVGDVLANGYQGPISVVVVADDELTAAAARATPALVLALPDRHGKAHALNVGVNHADTDIVVFTDANTRLHPGSLAAMVRWFEDPSVGAVAGEKTIARSSGESAYWRFESWLKQREARTGSTVGLVGELAALRRDRFQPLPANLFAEDLWIAIDVMEDGLRVVYEPTARAVEEPASNWREDWERRTRVGAGILDVLWRRRVSLGPSRRMLAAQLWGHRAVRSSFGPVAHLLLVGVAVGRSRRSRTAAAMVAGHAVAVVAMVRTQSRRTGSGLERLIGQTLSLQLVGLGGLIRYLRGNRTALWPKPERPPGLPSAELRR